MGPDIYQQAWHAQSSQSRVTIDAKLLLTEVRHNERQFHALILLRDVREIGIALLLLPLWFAMGYALALPWTWYLSVPALIWVAGFLVFDRMRHKQKASEPGDPLLKSVQESLAEL